MHDQKKQKKLNAASLIFTATLFVSLIFSTIIITSTSILMRRVAKEILTKYYESCQTTLKGNTKAIDLKIETYFTALDTFNLEQVISSGSNTEIQNFLIQFKEKNHKDFQMVFYVDSTGTEYAQNGKTYKVLERDYYNAIIKNGEESYISSPVNARSSNDTIFVIARAVKDVNKKTKGILCASIKLENLQNTLKDVKISEYNHIIIIDKNGEFICNPNPNWTSRTFTPSNNKYKEYSSIYVANTKEGVIQTCDTNGNDIMLFYNPSNIADWTIGLSVPLKELKSIYKRQNIAKWLICIIGFATLIVLLFIEFTSYRYLQKKQMFRNNYDSLTNLWTKEKFEDEAKHILKKYPKNKFMFIEADIRNLKFVNENYGEELADNMICFYSHMLEHNCTRNNGIMCRAYADHFYMLLKISSVTKAMSAFKVDMEKFSSDIKHYVVPFSPKFGIAFYVPENENSEPSLQTLIGQASFARQEIKDDALTPYAVFNSKQLEKINQELFIESNMEDALKNNEFFVMYQPKIDLKTNKISGAEALVRWNSKQYGLLPPDKFIPLFEKNGFVTKLDFNVYDQVFKFIQSQLNNNKFVVPVSVNMSRNHCEPEVFLEEFMKIFNKYDIPPEYIQVEILERSFMDNNTLKEITDNLHEKGFTVAMDDFGSGESSLNMLTEVPIDVIKFDRGFLNDSTDAKGNIKEKSADFIQILMELTKHLEKKSVFEGVETEAQRDFLKSINCDEIQGYFYSKPLKEEDFLDFIKKHS